jgi:hypothetical protein
MEHQKHEGKEQEDGQKHEHPHGHHPQAQNGDGEQKGEYHAAQGHVGQKEERHDAKKHESHHSTHTSHNLIMDYDDVHPAMKRKMEREAGKARAEGDSQNSDLIFYATLGVLILIFAGFFAVGYYKSHKREYTIEELHERNFKGKLDPKDGYVYKGVYSFVLKDGFWYTALQSQTGRSLYSFAFRYSPRDLEGLPVSGSLNSALFNNATEYYLTFNPTAENLSHTVLAVNDYNQHMLNVFSKTPIPACDRNETAVCSMRPIMRCDSTDDVVVYIKDDANPGVEFRENCIVILGRGFDQVKGVDRVLYKFYKIME